MKKLRVFETHGVIFSGTRGDEHYGFCPFTGKEEKFYVNVQTMLWDSKTAGIGGNIAKFLYEISKQNVDQFTAANQRRLSAHRNLPVEAFKFWHTGWDGQRYTWPVRDAKGVVQDVRHYILGKQMMSTSGCSTGLMGAEWLPKKPKDPVYVCEGEWDAIAMRWLLTKLKRPGVVICVPGVGTFKQEWVPWFNGRTVHVLYDADEAGENGDLLVQKRLGEVSKKITYTHWPSSVDRGFDVRDWIIYGAVDRDTASECFVALTKLFEPKPRKRDLPPAGSDGDSSQESEEERPSEWEEPPTLKELQGVFLKWLFLDNTDAVETMIAVHMSQIIDGPPIWMFLVAPPGGAKTEIIGSLSLCDQTYMTSSLTPHALISGANFKNMPDPSLIPRLDGRVMIVKDFTSILSMRDADKDEIFGILRDAYDGRCGKVFGTGVERNYKSRFTVMAAVTPRIYDLSSQHQSLGERFLKFSSGHNLEHQSERDIIRRAIDNINRETEMKWQLADVVRAFVNERLEWAESLDLGKYPSIDPDFKDKLIYLGMFGARLRGTVSRDTYRHDIMTSRPSAEVGSRLGIQLAKFVKALALVHRKKKCGLEEYRIVKKVVLDTIPQRIEDMVRTLVINCPSNGGSLTTQQLAKITRYPLATVSRLLQDLHVLDIVKREGSSYRHFWTISPYVQDCIDKSGLYESSAERKRPSRMIIKTKKRNK
tara:strand:+ start:23849 stop:25966 length:2118 start_codon:yes stop_codon:yes gene_type:complete